MCPFGPTFFNRDVSFPSGLQTSRPCFDRRRMLGAVIVWSGNPPAIFVQVIIRCDTAKAGAWGAIAPHVFIEQQIHPE